MGISLEETRHRWQTPSTHTCHSHGIRYELTDKNPIRSVRQTARRAKVPVLLEVAEIYRFFDVLALRERAMVVTDALTGIRRGDLMGLKLEDLDFIAGRINVVRWLTAWKVRVKQRRLANTCP